MANGHCFSAFWLRSSVSEDFNKVFFCGFFYPWFFGLDFYTFFYCFFLSSLESAQFGQRALCLALPWSAFGFALVWLGSFPWDRVPVWILVFDPSCVFCWFIWSCLLALGSLFLVPWSISFVCLYYKF